MLSKFTRIVPGSFLRASHFLAAALISFFMMPFVINSLGDRLYGFWVVITAFMGYYGLLDLGLTSAVIRHMAGAIGTNDSTECNKIFNTALFIFAILSMLSLGITGLIMTSIGYLHIAAEDIPLYRKITLILGLNFAINFPIKVFTGTLSAKLRYDIISSLQMFTLVLRTLLIVGALNAGHKLIALALISLLAIIPEMLLSIYFTKKNMPFLQIHYKYIAKDRLKSFFSYSIFTFIAQIADRLRFNVDAFVITIYIGLVAVTHYSIATELMRLFIGIIVAAVGVLQPIFSYQYDRKDHKALTDTYFFATRISFCLAAFIGFGMIAWGKSFIERWMGPEYNDAYPCLAILVTGCIIALSQTPSVNLLYGISKHRFYALFNSIEALCNLLLSVVLVKHFGLIGVALGTFIPMAIIKLIIQPIYVCKVAEIRYLDYVSMATKTAIAIVLALILPIALSLKFALPDYSILSILAIISACIYMSVIWLIGLDKKEKTLIRRAITG